MFHILETGIQKKRMRWADPEAWVITSRLENSQTFYTFSRWGEKKGKDRRKLRKKGRRGRRKEGGKRREERWQKKKQKESHRQWLLCPLTGSSERRDYNAN